MVKELWYRHLIKTGTWRVVAFTALAIITYMVTGSIALATSIALVDWIVKTILYFIHELVWSKLNVGRKVFSCKKGAFLWFTGLSGSGKTTLADAVAKRLEERMVKVKRLDGDVARRTFSSDLGFTPRDRAENCHRAAHVGSYLKENAVVLASFISPYKGIRDYAKRMGAEIVFVDCNIDECIKRDPKGMYEQLENGRFKGQPFTGMHPDAPYEPAYNDADLVIETDAFTLNECVDQVIKYLEDGGYV